MPLRDVATFAPTLPPHCETTNAFLVGISSYFYKCFPTPLALISVAMGICSIFYWLAAQIPQAPKNYRLQDTSGLSIYFLI